MTETVSGSAARKGRRKSVGGLKIRRIHTTPGTHPYDQVTWERRDVVMTNWRDGSVTPLRLATIKMTDSCVVNRRPHSGQDRRLRIAVPSSATRLSITRLSG